MTLDTALARRRDSLNPAELLRAALSACIIKGIERVARALSAGHYPSDRAQPEVSR